MTHLRQQMLDETPASQLLSEHYTFLYLRGGEFPKHFLRPPTPFSPANDPAIVRRAKTHTKLGGEVMSSGSVGDEATGTTGDLRRRPEKSREQHHKGLADVLICDGPLLFCGLFHDMTDIRITKDH